MDRKRDFLITGFVCAALAVAAAGILLLLLPQMARAGSTITVGPDGDYATIQAGVAAAQSGDTILVQSGAFTESIEITESLTLLGGYNQSFTARTPRSTKILGSTSVIWIYGEGIDATIDGFEITGGSASDGAGIAIRVSDGSRVVVNDNYIHDNRALDRGGGIHALAAQECELEITNNDVLSNTTSAGEGHDGGGIYAYVTSSGAFTLDGNRIERNHSGTNGGGFRAEVASFVDFSVDNNKVVSNTATAGPSGAAGGFFFAALYNSHGTFAGNQVIGNRAAGVDGAAYVRIAGNASSTFQDNEFKNNQAGAGFGGFYLEVTHNSRLIGGNLKIEGNTAGGDIGGAMVVAYLGSQIALPDLYAYDNRATGGAVGGVAFVLGGVPLSEADGFGFVARENAGAEWGGLGPLPREINGMNAITATNAWVISNTAGFAGGGAGVIANAGLVNLSGSRFISNTSSGNGGGLWVQDVSNGSAVGLEHTEFLTNTAGGSGGGAYFETGPMFGSSVDLSYARFVSNTARLGEGGGLYVGEQGSGGVPLEAGRTHDQADAICTTQVDHGEFVRNTAGSDGGGAYVGPSSADSQVIFDDCSFHDNTSLGGDGGGLYGAGCWLGGTFSVNQSSFQNNDASEAGGAMYFGGAYQGSEVYVNDNTVTRNHAGLGGGIYTRGFGSSSTIWVTGNEINDNTANDSAGGFQVSDWIWSNSALHFEDNEVQRNWSGGSIGGFGLTGITAGSALHFNRNLVNDNTALGALGGCGVIDIATGSMAEFMGNEFNRNTAGDDAGGLYFEQVFGTSQLRLWDNEVIDNRAGISGTLVTGGEGAGIVLPNVWEASAVDLRRNQILSNTAFLSGTAGGLGGGMYAGLNDSALLTMVDNVIAGNQAQHSFAGLYVDMARSSHVELEHNLISSNGAVTESGGLYIVGRGYSHYSLLRNTIVGNSAASYGGLWIEGDGSLGGMLENNLIADNAEGGVFLSDAGLESRNDTIANNGAYGISMMGRLTSTARLSNTIVWGHTWSFTRTQEVTYTDRFTMVATACDIEDGWPGTGNTDLDPLFVGGGDYHLQPGSPAIDQVDPATAPSIDLDGVARPMPASGLADMGCYEWFLHRVYLPLVFRSYP